MTPAALIPASPRIGLAMALYFALTSAVALSVWKIQGWRYGQQLERQERLHAAALDQFTQAATRAQQKELDKRLALEQRLTANDETHHKELTNAQQSQRRVLDQLATTQLRLSVVLSATSPGGVGMSSASTPSSVDHGTYRAELDPAHAQRIVGITDEGDRGLIVLRACQAYIRDLTGARH